MNKLLYATAAVGMLLAVNAAQAGDVLTAEQMDTVTAGVSANVSAAILSGPFTGTVTGAISTTPLPVSASITLTGAPPVGMTATTTVSATASAI